MVIVCCCHFDFLLLCLEFWKTGHCICIYVAFIAFIDIRNNFMRCCLLFVAHVWVEGLVHLLLHVNYAILFTLGRIIQQFD